MILQYLFKINVFIFLFSSGCSYDGTPDYIKPEIQTYRLRSRGDERRKPIKKVKKNQIRVICSSPVILNRKIIWNKLREKLSLEYMFLHHGMKSTKAIIAPRMIVVHHTGSNTFKSAWWSMEKPQIKGRPYISKSSSLNVSAHFLVDTDGKIYRLLSDKKFARHVIGLNYMAIGIENVGGTVRTPLTENQLNSNVKLIEYLLCKYPEIKFLIGHHEYYRFRKSSYWKEKNKRYYTFKSDPGIKFMKRVRKKLKRKIKSKP
ncbi:MAG: N-acetylmuramoyl-L-alanine amidase [Deltaproteobacteria bacterium]|nr:N-acetylmuramoyl-L-alanine amidase [Deltaproteobacteria bacterium]